MKNKVPKDAVAGRTRRRAARRTSPAAPRSRQRSGASPLAERAVERALSGRRAAYADEVRRLVEATFALIERDGDLDPRVGDIVRAAGLSNQAFYRHFPSKEALLVAVLDEGVRILASYLTHRMRRTTRPTAQVREWLRGMLAQGLRPEAAAATRPFVLGRARLAASFPQEVAESERALVALVREAIRAGVAAGELPDADPERDAETLYHQALGWLQARMLDATPPQPQDSERLVEFSIHGLLRGAASPPA